MLEPYDWQQEDIDKWVSAALSGESKSVGVFYEQSLGKTLVSVEYAKALDLSTIIIVGPLNTELSWRKAFNSQWPDMPFSVLRNTKEHLPNVSNMHRGVRGAYFISWELMRNGSIFDATVDLVIADETHRQQNRGSNSHHAISGLNSEYKLALSGTPAGNSPDGLFATIKWLWPTRYKNHQAWVDKFWRVRRNGAIIEFVREQKPGGVMADLPLYSRRLREDHREDLPQRLPEVAIPTDMRREQWKLYNALADSQGVWVDDEFMATSISLTHDLRLGQITLGVPTVDEDGEVTFPLDCKSSKMDMLFDVLKGQPKGATMLVLVPSARFIPAAVAQLNKKGYSARGFSGELTPSNSPERLAALEEFGEKFQVLVASIAAIAEGTDGLQHKCSRQFWLDKHPNNMLNSQANMRLDRPGQTEPVMSWYTYVPGTVNEDRIERLETVQGDLDEMIDNHR